MIVIRANTPDQVLEQTILSLLQQAQIEAEQITFCAKKKLELPGLVIDNTRHEISANGRNISLTRLESDLCWQSAKERRSLKKSFLMLYGERIALIP